jgi:hypothetical protein
VAVRAVVLDLDGTLIDPRQQPIPGIPEMMEALRAMDLRLAVASNQPGAARKLERAGLAVDFILDKALIGVNKGSPAWVTRALEEFGIESNELVWLGDSDPDMRSAVNAGIIYFNAGWSKPAYAYGINLRSPFLLPLYLQEFFQKPISWFWQFNGVDRQGNRVTAKAMMDANGAGIPAFKNDLISFLKEGGNPRVGPMSVRGFIFLHFVGSVFGDPFYRRVDAWTAYPSSRGGVNPALGALVNVVARLFRDRYLGDLLVRHTPSIDSGEARLRGEEVDFYNQSNTMRLNPEYRQRIQGKRIVVMDDFTTRGYSGECARQLLLEAGAAEVVCINVSKYGRDYWVISRGANDYAWDPYEVREHASRTFREVQTAAQAAPAALTMIRESYRRVEGWRRRQ